MSYKVAQISDCHLFADKHQAGYQGINPHNSLQAVLADVACHQPDLVILSGDVSAEDCAAKGLASYRLFSQLWQQSKLTAPLLVIPGNHDHLEPLNSELNDSAGWPVSLNAGACWQVHGLNTKTDDTCGEISTSELAYLTEQVQLNPALHHLLVVHHHPHACGGGWTITRGATVTSFCNVLPSFLKLKWCCTGIYITPVKRKVSNAFLCQLLLRVGNGRIQKNLPPVTKRLAIACSN